MSDSQTMHHSHRKYTYTSTNAQASFLFIKPANLTTQDGVLSSFSSWWHINQKVCHIIEPLICFPYRYRERFYDVILHVTSLLRLQGVVILFAEDGLVQDVDNLVGV